MTFSEVFPAVTFFVGLLSTPALEVLRERRERKNVQRDNAEKFWRDTLLDTQNAVFALSGGLQDIVNLIEREASPEDPLFDQVWNYGVNLDRLRVRLPSKEMRDRLDELNRLSEEITQIAQENREDTLPTLLQSREKLVDLENKMNEAIGAEVRPLAYRPLELVIPS